MNPHQFIPKTPEAGQLAADQVWKRRRDGKLVRVHKVYPGSTGWLTICNVHGMPRRRTSYIHRFIATHERYEPKP